MGQISYGLNVILNFYSILVIFWCLLTWMPNVDWEKQPAKSLKMLIEPYLNLFRNIIPPFGGIDLSPMIALFALFFFGNMLIKFLASMGL